MGLIGAGIGALLGSRGGLLSSILGALFGSWVEDRIRGSKKKLKADRGPEVRAAVTADPYAELGVTRQATDDEVRAAYREKAKCFHPDVLRAQGLSDEMYALAEAQMARLNAAWAEIRKERGL